MRYRLDSALFSLHTKLHAFDFDGHIPNQELIADSAVSLRHATAYLPYSRMTFKILMAEAQRTGINFVSFLDVGCGKGKPCLLAAQHYEFQAIQGIDFSQPLVDIANKNLAKTKYTNIQFIKCDATQFKLMGGNTVVYLFNPFNDIVLRAFLLLNMDHFTQNQSVIAYANDDHRHVLAELGFEVVYRSQVLKQSVWRINSSQPTLSYPSGGSTPSTVV
jgi:SAM-dependent methyltransferase